MARLKGRVAIVVGAGSIGPGWGNGKATAVAFAREGAQVVAVDVNGAACAQTCDLIREAGGDCEAVVADVSRGDEARGVVKRCLERFGRVDILHNNVGVMFPGGPLDVDEEVWDRAFSLNIKSMFLTCREVLPFMESQRSGSIINVGSISGSRYLGMPAIAYSTSKGAVVAFSAALAAQYGPSGIRVNTLTPGSRCWQPWPIRSQRRPGSCKVRALGHRANAQCRCDASAPPGISRMRRCISRRTTLPTSLVPSSWSTAAWA